MTFEASLRQPPELDAPAATWANVHPGDSTSSEVASPDAIFHASVWVATVDTRIIETPETAADAGLYSQVVSPENGSQETAEPTGVAILAEEAPLEQSRRLELAKLVIVLMVTSAASAAWDRRHAVTIAPHKLIRGLRSIQP